MRTLLATLLLTPFALAQGATVVPASLANSEGGGLIGIAGVGLTQAQQIVIDAVHLQPMVGHAITGIRFRRDAHEAMAFDGGSATITVWLGTAAHVANQVSADFRENLPNPVQVFDGTLAVPPAPSHAAPAPWSAPQSLEITFTTPFQYAGGPLAIEIDGTATGAGWWWPVDAVIDSAVGAVSPIGSACGAYAGSLGRTAFVATRDLVPGSTALFEYVGTPSAPALFVIGTAFLPQPVDLAFLGAPGCAWRISPDILVPTAVGAALPVAPLGGFASVPVRIPSSTTLLGSSFAVQWLELGSSLVTSEALQCLLSSSPPGLGAALVWREPGASSATVRFATIPVVRFDWQ